MKDLSTWLKDVGAKPGDIFANGQYITDKIPNGVLERIEGNTFKLVEFIANWRMDWTTSLTLYRPEWPVEHFSATCGANKLGYNDPFLKLRKIGEWVKESELEEICKYEEWKSECEKIARKIVANTDEQRIREIVDEQIAKRVVSDKSYAQFVIACEKFWKGDSK